jgi:hypothetical protein
MNGMSKFVRYSQCPKCLERGRDRAGDNLAEYSDGSFHCFSCGYHKFPKHYVKPNEEVLANVKKVLPADFSREVPARAWKWLLQYGLSYSYWQKYCGYSEKDQRLIFTVGEPTNFSIGRYIPTETNSSTDVRQGEGLVLHGARPPRKWYCYGDAHKTAHIIGEVSTESSIVLVEDLISAHKVGQITSCIPLFGTNVFNSVVNALRLYKHPVIMWLDKDQQDQARKRATRLSMLTGCDVRFIFTDKDPKELSIKDIEEVIK